MGNFNLKNYVYKLNVNIPLIINNINKTTVSKAIKFQVEMNFDYSNIFVAIATNNIQTLVDFYSQLFQKQATVYQPPIYAEFDLKMLRIGIFKPKSEDQQFNNLGGSSISLCIEVENLEQAIATLTEMGYPPPGKIITASHGQEIYAYDSAGNRLILHQSHKV